MKYNAFKKVSTRHVVFVCHIQNSSSVSYIVRYYCLLIIHNNV